MTEKIQYTLFQLAQELTDFFKRSAGILSILVISTYRWKHLKEVCLPIAVSIDFSVQRIMRAFKARNLSHFILVSLYTHECRKEPVSFWSISENTRHDPSAIWAHLHFVLQTVKQSNPSIKTVNFLSDGPTTQYRSKKQFILIKKMHREYGFETEFQCVWARKGGARCYRVCCKTTSRQASCAGKRHCWLWMSYMYVWRLLISRLNCTKYLAEILIR